MIANNGIVRILFLLFQNFLIWTPLEISHMGYQYVIKSKHYNVFKYMGVDAMSKPVKILILHLMCYLS